ncbi:MAG: hypothetical protein J6T01_05980 [Kiritimatiellae bacterium]|nr:hypothetical protein [Kiritimatiellia bacterium]
MSKSGKQSTAESEATVSGVLVGRNDHALDPKKRLTIPSEWRAVMGNPDYVYVMPGRNGKCLNLVPKTEMEMRLAKLREKALFDPALTEQLRAIGAVSEQLVLDVQGRIRISDRLLQFANLTTTVAMLGSVRVIELWDPARVPGDRKVDMAGYRAALDKLGF